MKITYYCAISKDEFIAREDGDVSWLDDLDMAETGAGYEAFFASVDALVMGRTTYDFVFDYGSWPYGDILTWIVTSKPLETLEGANLRVVPSVSDFVNEAVAKDSQHIWLVGGGKLASAFLDRGMLTDLRASPRWTSNSARAYRCSPSTASPTSNLRSLILFRARAIGRSLCKLLSQVVNETPS